MQPTRLLTLFATFCCLVHYAAAALETDVVQRLVLESFRPMDSADTNGYLQSEIAYNKLVSLGGKAMPYLAAIAQNTNLEWRTGVVSRAIAIEALGDIPSEQAVSALTNILCSNERTQMNKQGLMEAAITALAKQGSPAAVRFLLEEASRPGAGRLYYYNAFFPAIASVTNPAAVAILGKYATNEIIWVDSQKALAHIGTEGAVDALIGCLSDPRPGVRRESAKLLGTFRQRNVLKALQTALAKEGDDMNQVTMATSIIRHDPTNGPALYLLREYASSEWDNLVRSGALMGLSEAGGPDNKKFLQRFLYDSDSEIRLSAVDAFANVAGEPDLKVFDEIAKRDENDDVREQAQKTVAKLRQRLLEKRESDK